MQISCKIPNTLSKYYLGTEMKAKLFAGYLIPLLAVLTLNACSKPATCALEGCASDNELQKISEEQSSADATADSITPKIDQIKGENSEQNDAISEAQKKLEELEEALRQQEEKDKSQDEAISDIQEDVAALISGQEAIEKFLGMEEIQELGYDSLKSILEIVEGNQEDIGALDLEIDALEVRINEAIEDAKDAVILELTNAKTAIETRLIAVEGLSDQNKTDIANLLTDVITPEIDALRDELAQEIDDDVEAAETRVEALIDALEAQLLEDLANITDDDGLLATLRTELEAQITTVDNKIGPVKTSITQLETDLLAKIDEKVNTTDFEDALSRLDNKLSRRIRGLQFTNRIQFAIIDFLARNANQRFAALEQKIDDLETNLQDQIDAQSVTLNQILLDLAAAETDIDGLNSRIDALESDNSTELALQAIYNVLDIKTLTCSGVMGEMLCEVPEFAKIELLTIIPDATHSSCYLDETYGVSYDDIGDKTTIWADSNEFESACQAEFIYIEDDSMTPPPPPPTPSEVEELLVCASTGGYKTCAASVPGTIEILEIMESSVDNVWDKTTVKFLKAMKSLFVVDVRLRSA